MRDRGTDKYRIADLLLAELCSLRGVSQKRLTSSAKQKIDDYHWPGNVRELKHCLERALVFHEGDLIEAPDLELGDGGSSQGDLGTADRGLEVGDSGVQVRLPEEGASMEAIERTVLEEALKQCGGNVSAAARHVGLTREKFRYRASKHGLLAENGKARRRSNPDDGHRM